METLDRRDDGGNKSKILIALVVLVAAGLACLCAGGSIAWPAFERYTQKSKALEAVTNSKQIALAAKMYYEDNEPGACEFPPSAGPLPALLDCCKDVCRREESETRDPGWRAVEFDTLQTHRFAYQAINQGDAYVVRATADLDCDGVTSLYETKVSGRLEPDGTCVAVVGELTKQDEFE